jgi:hypothetical protein
MPNHFPLPRRQFLTTSATLIGTGYFSSRSFADDSKSPNERLNLAGIGTTGQAGADLGGMASQNISIVTFGNYSKQRQGRLTPWSWRHRTIRMPRQLLWR